MRRRYAQSETGRWDETLGNVLGVDVKHRFGDEPIGAGTMGGRWAKKGKSAVATNLGLQRTVLRTKRKPALALR